MELVMVEGAQQHQPVEIGAPPERPVVDVVHIAVTGRSVTARGPTVMIAGDDCGPQPPRGRPFVATEFDHATPGHEDAVHDRITGEQGGGHGTELDGRRTDRAIERPGANRPTRLTHPTVAPGRSAQCPFPRTQRTTGHQTIEFLGDRHRTAGHGRRLQLRQLDDERHVGP